jgi:hypothetical protein
MSERPTTYEMCQRIRRLIVARAAEVMAYENWSDGFATRQIREIPDVVRRMDGFVPVLPHELTSEQMDDLGFGLWSKENPIRLIPLWLLPFLADEFPAGSIDGDSGVMRRDELDNDHRFGCLAYGVTPCDANPRSTNHGRNDV